MRITIKITTIIFLLFLQSCANTKIYKTDDKIEKKLFSSTGFALIYEQKLFDEGIISKKIDNNEIVVFHSQLRKNTPIKIINPENSKTILTNVHKRAKYENIFSIAISDKIAKILELDIDNPYVEVLEVKKNKKFIAKEGKTFEEEKNVADNAPVEKIEIDDLSKDNKLSKKEYKKKKHNFILLVSDFYYLESAVNLKKELIKKTNLDNFVIKKINDKKYRLYVGPFKNFNSLKSTYISLNKIGFNELNVYKE